MSHVILIALLALPARAGLRAWCARHLISQDPYEYEQTPDDALCRKLRALEIRERWRKLDFDEANDLAVIRGEFAKRQLLADTLGFEPPKCP